MNEGTVATVDFPDKQFVSIRFAQNNHRLNTVITIEDGL
jgi:hypothetical protein